MISDVDFFPTKVVMFIAYLEWGKGGIFFQSTCASVQAVKQSCADFEHSV